MPASQVIQPAQQSQVVTKGQPEPRGQLTSFIFVDDQQPEPLRPLTFALTQTKHFNPPSVASATGKQNHTTYHDPHASLIIYSQSSAISRSTHHNHFHQVTSIHKAPLPNHHNAGRTSAATTPVSASPAVG